MKAKILISLLIITMIYSFQVYAVMYQRFNGVCERNQRIEVIEAESNKVEKGGFWRISPSGKTLWLYGNGAWAKVTSTVPSDVIYIQYDHSDSNDGFTHIYVDDLPEYFYCTRNLGFHYVKISGLPNTIHTVKVVSKGYCNRSYSDHNQLGFFAFGDLQPNIQTKTSIKTPIKTPTKTPTKTLTKTPITTTTGENLIIIHLLRIIILILILIFIIKLIELILKFILR